MAKRKKPNYYAVRVGRKPGVYDNWEQCEKQVLKFSNAVFKGFDTYDAALAFVGDATASNPPDIAQQIEDSKPDNNPASLGGTTGVVSFKVEDAVESMPPPASQSYFDQFPDFAPDSSAPFDDEFSRFASSQGLESGSQEYRRERTKAIRDELKFHYSSQDATGVLQTIPEFPKRSLDDSEKLDIYQNMCREIGVNPQDTIAACRRELKGVLVNIVDYIDARRIGKPVKIWDWSDFHSFCIYSLQDDKRMDIREAKADGGFLSALLQKITGPRPRKNALASLAVGNRNAKRRRTDQRESSIVKRRRLSTSSLLE
ncbi:Caulimovirus viroplasmin-domain-containing protein [Daldinia caldariorum]|uniref:Caulimovirus viroplasmin-domain-containing protein n=1 Tax=Daldinia caldariorum TaxID=326644 RepID=UPI0020083611|nr:Caulimovirus viroplasmin-domain-containing protein [Daldinia caldariorum]KAI1464417.1 Caulimovirus viroplasmin-domain-containing protein [Daldinia caldariorum]